MIGPTVEDVRRSLEAADEREFAAIERSLAGDPRKGVQQALARARRRLEAARAERGRVEGMYAFERGLAQGRGDGVVVGLDEVGRGPVAGPLAAGAVVLPREPLILGLNDSKQVRPAERERLAEEIKRTALVWAVVYVEPADIDSCGMAASLVGAFRRAVARVEAAGVRPDVVLLDGNPLHLDGREVSVVKGDARCASIAAASIVAKVERDALMCRLAEEYPGYGLESNKGYASAGHIEAIRRLGLSPVHRASFCRGFLADYVQESLF